MQPILFSHTTQHIHRRRFLTGLTTGAVGLVFSGAAHSQIDRTVPITPDMLSPEERSLVPAFKAPPASVIRAVRRIDVHHHAVPQAYVDAVSSRTGLSVALNGWTPQKSLASMDQAGVATAILSIPANGLWFPDPAENRRLARACNDYTASVVKDHPGRFGFWATLPLTDIEGSLSEVKYALDTLRADGINLFTVYGNKWLGDPAFERVMAALNERKAVVYTHPTIGTCCNSLLPGIPPAVVEYGTDTARTIASLLFMGVATRYPDIKFIFSHAGGTMPALLERYLWQGRQPNMASALPNGILPPLRKFYYDVAQATNPSALLPLVRIVTVSQVLFGSDFPYRTCIEPVAGLAGSDFSMSEQSAIGRQNALRLVPRFA